MSEVTAITILRRLRAELEEEDKEKNWQFELEEMEKVRKIAEEIARKKRYEEKVMIPWESTQNKSTRCSLPGLPGGE